MSTLKFLLRLAWGASVWTLVGCLWVVALARDALGIARGAAAGRRAAARGTVVCERGHATLLWGKFECGSCGFRYTGSALWCPNKECPAPATAFINCSEPSCGLSIPSPSRWGSP